MKKLMERSLLLGTRNMEVQMTVFSATHDSSSIFFTIIADLENINVELTKYNKP